MTNQQIPHEEALNQGIFMPEHSLELLGATPLWVPLLLAEGALCDEGVHGGCATEQQHLLVPGSVVFQLYFSYSVRDATSPKR